ncbi:MAG: phosphomannomutase, partial [Pseudomonadota bacterium]|nr:phosphomannomutase [Pseudomonadota bacterium]
MNLHDFNRTILREYDVRGVVGSTLFPADATALGRSYAALATSEGAKRVAVGRDGRTHSPEFEAALIEGLTAGGLDVVRIGLGPSPMLYFAVATLDVDGGIQVTGSHNPSDYNGFKMLLNGRSVFGEEIKALGRRAEIADWCDGAGSVSEADVIPAYLDALLKG